MYFLDQLLFYFDLFDIDVVIEFVVYVFTFNFVS